MSKFPVGQCSKAGWQAAPSTWLLAPGESPAAPLPRGMLHTWHGGSVRGAVLVQATATGMEPLCDPAAAPALGDTVALVQAGSTGEMELLAPT